MLSRKQIVADPNRALSMWIFGEVVEGDHLAYFNRWAAEGEPPTPTFLGRQAYPDGWPERREMMATIIRGRLAGRTRNDIGRYELGLSASRVNAVEGYALRHLRHPRTRERYGAPAYFHRELATIQGPPVVSA